MVDVLEWINLDELPELIVLIGLLWVIGGKMTRPTDFSNRWLRRVVAMTLLTYSCTAIYAWSPSSAGDAVVILIRALLAAGLVGGAASIVLPLGHPLVLQVLEAMKRNRCDHFTEREQRLAQDRAAREARRRRWRNAQEAARQEAQAETKLREAAAEAGRLERERHAKTDEARATVIRFYASHEPLLRDTLPRDLVRAQLQTRFPGSVTAEQAWQAAQEMIASMLPLIAEAREQEQRAAKEEETKRSEDKQPMTIPGLTAWYKNTTREIEEHLPDGPEREDILHEVWDRYDELVKRTLKELQP